jgi:GNAT superfamily N-acetyltransferase
MELKEEPNFSVDNYLKLRAQVNWKPLSRPQARKALANSLYIVVAYEDGEPVGMGRIVGDGAVICYVQDLIIVPAKQGHGIGTALLDKLHTYVEHLRLPDTEMMFGLMCAKGRETFYEQNGFCARPTQHLGPGMIQYLKDSK